MRITAFTIFVFGGAITDVAIAYDVLESKKKKKPAAKKVVPNDNAWERLNTNCLLPWLTFPEEVHPDESGARFGAAMAPPEHSSADNTAIGWASAKNVLAAVHLKKGLSTKEVKYTLNHEELEMVLQGVGTASELSTEDKIDELRIALPSVSTSALKKLLSAAGNDVHEAIVKGQAGGFY